MIAPEYSRRRRSSTTSADLEQTALAFGAAIVDVERRLVSSGWHHPQRLRAAAAEYGLCADDFLCINAQLIFTVLQADTNNDADAVNRRVLRAGVRFGAALDIRYLEVVATGIENWASLLAQYRQRVEKAQEHLREADRLLAGGLRSELFERFESVLRAPGGLTKAARRGVA